MTYDDLAVAIGAICGIRDDLKHDSNKFKMWHRVISFYFEAQCNFNQDYLNIHLPHASEGEDGVDLYWGIFEGPNLLINFPSDNQEITAYGKDMMGNELAQEYHKEFLDKEDVNTIFRYLASIGKSSYEEVGRR